MMANRTDQKLKIPASDNEHQIELYRIRNARDRTRWIVGAIATVCCVGLAIPLPIYLSAGEQTSVHYTLNWLLNLRAETVLAWGATASLWYRSRYWKKIAEDERVSKGPHVAKLESHFDKNRSSSRVTEDGTRLEDRDPLS